MRMNLMHLLVLLTAGTFVGTFIAGATHVSAQVVRNTNGLDGGDRWDAAPRVIGGLERSLNGGIRYSVQDGSLPSYRNMFMWTQTPTDAEFESLIQQAFDAWGSTDPVSGLTSSLAFVFDPTPAELGLVQGTNVLRGAEIDLYAIALGPGGPSLAHIQVTPGPVQLSSGTQNYDANAIVGADLLINRDNEYSQDEFRRLLTHEIGHALGLEDVDRTGAAPPNNLQTTYIDDNYDGSSVASATATLTNNWAHLVNATNPSASQGLSLFTVPVSNTGFQAPGVDILMESFGVGIGPSNPVTSLTPLSNADYSIRQFLYPSLVILGDCNEDGVVNFLDIIPFIGFLSSNTYLQQADCNEDGSVTFLDIAPFIGFLNGG